MNGDKQLVCVVVPIAFRPYPETEEFACVGVLLHSPDDNRFGYRLTKVSERAFNRVNGFFREIDVAVFKHALRCARHDIEGMISMATEELDPRVRENAFANLIRPRESSIRYGRPHAVMTDDFEAETERQYERIVQRTFIDREGYYEQKMRKRVIAYLMERKIAFERQKRYTFEKGCYSFTLPVVIGTGGNAKAIKPLNFVMKNGTETMEHWFKWQRRFEYLKGEGLDKDRILVPIRLPSAERIDVYNAAMIAFEELRRFTRTVSEDDARAEKEEILAFAS